ncbi:hydantoinase/oxoprolinase family protein [Chelativorans sp. AA-79]|uniref:hydantoinase/oxoprolinase family protein n=1 Tax=Chelativorans sp. AA-79 TaxID=3028735 RepID=UPI0023F934C2|nr:hydantoinase/oxoprolinase family protein [Chelativorans sp. AA-79]WEX09249.1 hydantoinase/oxoprolinase family protein [Chelativorans sp. AA-79]
MHDGPRDTVLLGIDTGGTYTDAVLYSERAGLVAKAKALTTRHDLAEGIAAAADAVLARTQPARVGLVSMSTTLATNAVVEGQGGRVGLVMIGFAEADLERDGLRTALGQDPLLLLQGGHDVHGNETPLDLTPLGPWIDAVAPTVTAIAVCGYFAVRNPAHEMAVCDLIRARTGLPVTASHELSAKLGGPRRALTTLLNSRLISLIERLIAATASFLEKRGIEAPLMVVRGDGALISASLARMRPIETILSGPAASLVGARHLTGLDDAIISDIGGTTTDIALLTNGRPRLDPEGAMVGGWRTMVEAVAMRTYGLGGDSEVALEDGTLEPRLRLGPRRLIPLSLAETLFPGFVKPELERQLRRAQGGRLDGRFAYLTGLPERFAAGLSENEEKLFRRFSATPQPLDRVIGSNIEFAILQRLVSRGLAQISGFTPSDAAHVTGLQATWDPEAARLGAELFARRRDGRGRPLAGSAGAISESVLRCLTRRSAEAILETAFAEDDTGFSPANPLVQRALDGTRSVVDLSLSLDRPVIGLGASARLHYAGLERFLSSECVLPDNLDVANAIGAIAGQVQVTVHVDVTQPREGLFRVSAGAETRDFREEGEALAFAEEQGRMLATARAAEAGAETAEVTTTRTLRTADIDGQRLFLEATVTAVAAGRPRIAA